MSNNKIDALVEKKQAFNDLMDGTVGCISFGKPSLGDDEEETITISQSLD